jgi:ABC-type oligopeptide transport system substrate-binding subunit
MMRRTTIRLALLAVLAVLTGLALSGCSKAASSEESGAEPASVEAIDGSEVGQVTLTEEAAGRIGLKTDTVRGVAEIGAPGATQVPLSAVLYDKDGKAWVYTSPKPLTFVRVPIGIEQVDGDNVLLRSGPPPGTAVVTVGGAELLGTEYVVEGE